MDNLADVWFLHGVRFTQNKVENTIFAQILGWGFKKPSVAMNLTRSGPSALDLAKKYPFVQCEISVCEGVCRHNRSLLRWRYRLQKKISGGKLLSWLLVIDRPTRSKGNSPSRQRAPVGNRTNTPPSQALIPRVFTYIQGECSSTAPLPGARFLNLQAHAG